MLRWEAVQQAFANFHFANDSDEYGDAFISFGSGRIGNAKACLPPILLFLEPQNGDVVICLLPTYSQAWNTITDLKIFQIWRKAMQMMLTFIAVVEQENTVFDY